MARSALMAPLNTIYVTATVSKFLENLNIDLNALNLFLIRTSINEHIYIYNY